MGEAPEVLEIPVSDTLYEKLVREAQKRGKTVDEVAVQVLSHPPS